MELKYIVTETIYHNGKLTRTAYGIALVDDKDGVTIVLDSIDDISITPDKMYEAVKCFNTLGLSRKHFHDAVEELV